MKEALRSRLERSLLVIDQEPLRKEASAAYRQIMTRLETARAEWARFTDEDQPAYARWVSVTFGPLLTRSRELKEELRDKLLLIEELESEHWMRGGSRHSAYDSVMARRANPGVRDRGSETGRPDDEPEEPEGDREELFEAFVRDTFGVDPGVLPAAHYDALRAEFDRAMEEDDAGEDEERELGGEAESAQCEAAPLTGSIKEKYRWLVRQLHPDTRKEARPDLLALWHDVQQAYLARDLERLETLVALVEMREGFLGGQTTFFQARSALREMEAALKALTRSIRDARRETMWCFSLLAAGEREELRARVEYELRAEIECVSKDLARASRALDAWAKAPAARTSVRRPGRSARMQDQFGF